MKKMIIALVVVALVIVVILSLLFIPHQKIPAVPSSGQPAGGNNGGNPADVVDSSGTADLTAVDNAAGSLSSSDFSDSALDDLG